MPQYHKSTQSELKYKRNIKKTLFCADRFSHAQIVGTRNKERPRNKERTRNKERFCPYQLASSDRMWIVLFIILVKELY